MSFGKYKKQAPQSGKAVPYTLFCFRNPDGTSPVLHVEYLGESNRPFWLETLARAKAKTGAAIATTPTEIDRDRRTARDSNRETVISHSARKIDNAFHDDGTPATEKDLRAIVLAIPDEDFDMLFGFVQNHGNYREFVITEDPAAVAEK